MKKLEAQAGFTMIETMIVVVVASTLAAVGVPSLRHLSASQNVRAAAARLQSSLMLTRAEALKRNANVSVSPVLTGQWNAGWKVVNPDNGNNVSTYGALSSVTITGPGSVVFRGSGRVSDTADAMFRLTSVDSTEMRCVQITLSGVPTITSSGC